MALRRQRNAQNITPHLPDSLSHCLTTGYSDDGIGSLRTALRVGEIIADSRDKARVAKHWI